MEIATREVQIKKTIDYCDGCTEKIYILKYYVGNEKTTNFRWKMVEFRHPDGTIDEDRSNTYRGNMDETDEHEIGYREKEIEMLKTIHHNDNSTKTIKLWKIHTIFMDKPVCRHKMVEFRHPNGTIDKDRSNTYSYEDDCMEIFLRMKIYEANEQIIDHPLFVKYREKSEKFYGFQSCLSNDLNEI